VKKIKLAKIPLSPGVYLFKNAKDDVIYVGRATALRKRVASYFQKNLDPRIAQMVSEAKKIDLKKTANLLEAVILEANLIKKYWPKYNIREKDNRSFIYIVIPKKEWTYPLIIRGQQLSKYPPEKARTFGPFKSYSTAKNLLLLLRKIFPWSTCKPNQGKPCFYYQIGLCPGKCTGAITKKDYQKNINGITYLLRGEKDKVKRILKKTGPDKLKLLDHIDDSILITGENNFWENGSRRKNHSPHIGRIEGYDISHFSGKETVGSMVVWQNEDFDKSQYRLFKIHSARPNDDLAALEEILVRRLKHKEWVYPDLIMVDGGKTQVKIMEKILTQEKINIPVVGISKYESDRLVFGKMQKSLKNLISISFPQLLKIRNEAHRFANSLRKKLLKKSYK
jgi:excinuclease ABC subunit C